jgi:hypothetical protein
MRSRRLALVVLAPILIALGGAALACANFWIPAACDPVCEPSTSEPCQQCIAKEEAKREEARRKREEALSQSSQSPAPAMGGGASPSGY